MSMGRPVVSVTGVDISVLFITYNRSDLLEITYEAARRRISFGDLRVEFIVSDNASDEPHRSRIKALAFDKYLIAELNRGLANNLNKGIAGSAGTYVLQIEDDCEFVGESGMILTALRILQADAEVGMVQLTDQTTRVPHEIRQLEDGTRYRVFVNDGLRRRRGCGERPYTDQPHLKRVEFCRDIGPYGEGTPMSQMEIEYQQRVACQNRWHVAAIEGVSGFKHLGALRSTNESQLRAKRRAQLYAYPIVGPLLDFLRPVARRARDGWRELGP